MMRSVLRQIKTMIVTSISLGFLLFSLSYEASSSQTIKENTNDLGILNNLVVRKLEELNEIKSTVLLMKAKRDADGESLMNANIANEIQNSIDALEVKKLTAQNNSKKMKELISEVISVVYQAKNRRQELQRAP